MRRTSKRILGSLIVVSFLFTSAACGGSNDSSGDEPSGNFDLRIAQGSAVEVLDPMIKDSSPMRAILFGNIFESLVAFETSDATQATPVLAKSWTRVDDTTWEFDLETGVTFHNGEPFNAEAAVFSIKRFINPDQLNELAGQLETVKDAVVVDDDTIRVLTSVPDAQLVSRMVWVMMMPTGSPNNVGKAPVGTGPYKFVSRTAESIELEAWDDYRDGKAEAANVTYTTITEAGARVSGLQSGEFDIILDLPIDSAELAPKVEQAPGFEVVALRPNADGGLTADESVREAIAMGIDIDGLREGLWGEYASPTEGNLVPESVSGFNSELEDPAFDPDQARSMLEAAGAVGETIRLMVPVGRYPKNEDTAQVVASNLSEVGLEVDVQIVPYEEWLDAILTHTPESPELFLTAAGSEDFRSAMQPFINYLHPDAVAGQPPTDEYPEFGELMSEAQSTADPEEQEALLREVGALSQEAAAMIPLYTYDTVYGAAENISWDVRGDNRIMLNTVTRD